VQDNFTWTPPVGPLGRLTDAAHARAERIASRVAELRDQARDTPRPTSFAAALVHGTTVAVIAELKRQSPSKGVLNSGIRASDRARRYVAGGARALSVLTEPSEFGGDNQDLIDVRAHVRVPLLKKDFHVHEGQVWEARALGASAILFIARALAPGQLARLVDAAFEAGLEPLVEIRDERELQQALATPARVIGVNARDLETLVLEPDVTARVLPAIPADRVRVAESGMTSPDDVARAAALGADAVLVGSSLSLAADPEELLRTLSCVERHIHGR